MTFTRDRQQKMEGKAFVRVVTASKEARITRLPPGSKATLFLVKDGLHRS
jgi:hypothetical protein